MIRFMYVDTQSATGESVDEARAAVAAMAVPESMQILAEETIQEVRQQPIGAIADTLEQARDELRRKLPDGARDLVEEVISAPEKITEIWEAYDDQKARDRARTFIACELWGKSVASIRKSPKGRITHESLFEVVSAKLVSTGRKGWLGLGQRDNKYEVVVMRKACIEASYTLRPGAVRTVGREIKCTGTLQLCMRNDNLNAAEDMIRSELELRAEGRLGSMGLGKLIEVCIESRSPAILQAVAAARHAEPTPELHEALEHALTASTWNPHDGAAFLAPELTSGNGSVVGWSDATQAGVQAKARECLDALSLRPQSDERPEPIRGSIIIACARCPKPAGFRLGDELLCFSHYHS